MRFGLDDGAKGASAVAYRAGTVFVDDDEFRAVDHVDPDIRLIAGCADRLAAVARLRCVDRVADRFARGVIALYIDVDIGAVADRPGDGKAAIGHCGDIDTLGEGVGVEIRQLDRVDARTRRLSNKDFRTEMAADRGFNICRGVQHRDGFVDLRIRGCSADVMQGRRLIVRIDEHGFAVHRTAIVLPVVDHDIAIREDIRVQAGVHARHGMADRFQNGVVIVHEQNANFARSDILADDDVTTIAGGVYFEIVETLAGRNGGRDCL